MVAADRDRVPLRDVFRGPLEAIHDKSERGLDRVDPRVLRHVLLEDVILNRPSQLPRIDALLLSCGDVEAIENDRRSVDGHRRRDLIERDAVEQHFHVGEAGDGDTALADLAFRSRMIRVVAHQGRKVERYGKTCLPVIEQELVSLVGIARAAEAGELAHRPQPSSVAGRVHAAGVGINARHAKRLGAGLGCIERGVDRLQLFFRVVESDVAQLTLLVLLTPLSDLLPQQPQLGTLLFDRLDQLAMGTRLGGGARAFQFRHLSSSPRTSSPLCRNN